MTKKLTTTFLFVLVSLFAYSQTVVEVIVNSADHNTLETAVIEAGLVDALNGDGPFTVFAPTDAAFNLLEAGTVDELLADPTGDLARILLYHVIGAEVLSTDLSDGQSAPTLLGQNIEVSLTSGVMINNAMVTVANVPASNGVVHVIDAVLLPPASTVVDVVVNSDVHTSLEEAVILAELDDDLSGEGPFTLFAPTDDAFALIDPTALAALFDDPTGDLANILLYHAVSGEVLSTDLNDGMMATTLYNNQDISVTINSDGVFINDAEVTVANIRTLNGVVHVIDAVLIPTLSSVKDLNETVLSVFPNPATNQLNLEFPEEMINKNVSIDLVNTNGKVMNNWSLTGQNTNLDISQYPTGMYFLLLTSDEHFAKAKVVFGK